MMLGTISDYTFQREEKKINSIGDVVLCYLSAKI